LEEFNIKTSSFLAIALMLSVLTTIAWASEEKSGITGEQALQKLIEGNARFASGNASHPDQSMQRRSELVADQHPFAVIVGCSDSRIPPELIFDQGLGDIFVIRTAGQVLDNVSLGSIEYAVEHLGVPLVVVLGHDSCGAVSATVKGGEVTGHLDSLVNFIQPAVDEAREMGNVSELLNNSIDNNVYNIVDDLLASQPILSEKVEKGELMIVGARYHLDSGEVQIFK
jgi:carbonic anhydrase